ncbi:unnamed protein product [Clonostachys rosea]|uniref:Uncharacterized protein n=1 Tax=Bionectria ochroleuca TaxID=29856 RepID=A0ABY6UL95_BIOOC|nr:unnamed protein product [Clonostachys rosea]
MTRPGPRRSSQALNSLSALPGIISVDGEREQVACNGYLLRFQRTGAPGSNILALPTRTAE